MKKIKYEISESERIIMNYLWESSTPKKFADIMEYLENKEKKEWKKQTVNTFLKRLIDKGLIQDSFQGKNKLYSPSIRKVDFERGEAQNYLNACYSGSLGNFISALSGGKKIDSDFADQLRKLVEDK